MTTYGPEQLPDAPLLTELERIAIEVATEAAALILHERPRELGATSKSSATDVVTVMDTRSEALIRQSLARLRPDDGLLGEEGSDRPGSTGLTWVVDPVDGTTNYLYELPLYAVSVAVVVGTPPQPGWLPVAGAVVAPVLDTCWSARRGGGARRSHARTAGAQAADASTASRPVQVGSTSELSQALLGTGFGYTAERRAEQARVLTRVLPRVRDIRRLGSAAVDLCLVADGRLDLFYEEGLNPWDVAAGWLIATEAGAQVHGPDGGAPDSKLTLAGNRLLVPDLAQLLAH